MQTVVVVDYGMGNVHSMQRALQAAAQLHAGARSIDVRLSRDADVIYRADRVVLPGQGAMGGCMRALQDSGLTEVLRQCVQRKPLLGVCVGMQMLLNHSDEGDTAGLGWLDGQVRRLAGGQDAQGTRLKIPHMGWNAVRQNRPTADAKPHALWQGIADDSLFYFVHSYYGAPTNPLHCAGTADYGARFCVALADGLVFATQFHPEKSAAVGLQLLHNFLYWQP